MKIIRILLRFGQVFARREQRRPNTGCIPTKGRRSRQDLIPARSKRRRRLSAFDPDLNANHSDVTRITISSAMPGRNLRWPLGKGAVRLQPRFHATILSAKGVS